MSVRLKCKRCGKQTPHRYVLEVDRKRGGPKAVMRCTKCGKNYT